MSHETILVVDDNAMIREFIVDAVLKPNGYRALIARDGVEALDIIQHQRPDLMLLDLQMPRMDGLEVLSHINTERLDVPVILMTAHGSEAIAVDVFRRGVRDYIMKGETFAAEDITAAIERSLAEVRLRKQKEQLTERLISVNAELNRHLRELRILYSIGKSVTALMDMDGLMRRVVGAATILTGSEEGGIFVIERDELICRALKRAADERPYPLNRPMSEPLAAQAIDTCTMVVTHQNGRKASSMAAPLVIAGQAIGALVVKNHSGADFGEHDGELLSALADYAAIAYRTQGEINPEDRASLQKALQTKTIFISYSRRDWDTFVTPLVDKLRSVGMNVWIDQHLLEGGQDWLTKIGQALDECSVMVLCVTPEALESQYVQMEYRYFWHQRKPIIPVICKDARFPAELVGIQNLRYNETDKLIDRLQRLLRK